MESTHQLLGTRIQTVLKMMQPVLAILPSFRKRGSLASGCVFWNFPRWKGSQQPSTVCGKDEIGLAKSLSASNGNCPEESAKNKRMYDRKVKHQTLAVGDRVLMMKLAVTGKNKLGDKWNSVPYLGVKS